MRITLDLDEPSELKLLKAYYNLRQFGNVEVRRSSSGRGYHMIVRGLPISYDASLLIRAMLGECKTRLRFDSEKNMKPKQILWSAKTTKGRRHEVRRIMERDLLAQPFFSRVPRSVYI